MQKEEKKKLHPVLDKTIWTVCVVLAFISMIIKVNIRIQNVKHNFVFSGLYSICKKKLKIFNKVERVLLSGFDLHILNIR